jgi:ubiquinone biosynthesis protein COQ9
MPPPLEPATCQLKDSSGLKELFLKELLESVGAWGWTDEAFQEAAQKLGLSPAWAWALFPGGSLDAIACWSHQGDQEMLATLGTLPLCTFKVRKRIFEAVRIRLDLQTPLKGALRETLVFLASPPRSWMGVKLAAQTANAMWWGIGDQSTDYNYYTKRGLLTGVYVSTLVFWVHDHSPNASASWDFLERRIEEVLRIQGAKARFQGQRDKIVPFVQALGQWGRERLGI